MAKKTSTEFTKTTEQICTIKQKTCIKDILNQNTAQHINILSQSHSIYCIWEGICNIQGDGDEAGAFSNPISRTNVVVFAK